MKYFIKILFILLIFVIIGDVYSSWFIHSNILSGDWPFFYNENIQYTPLFPSAWSPTHNNGLGGNNQAFFIDQYLYFSMSITKIFHLPWNIGYKIFWYFSFLLCSIGSSYYFLSKVGNQFSTIVKLIGVLIYTTNTYILLVVGGGQMGYALAYAIFPFIFTRIYLAYGYFEGKKKNIYRIIYNVLFSGLVLGVLLTFDPRIFYIGIISIFLFIFIQLIGSSSSLKEFYKNILGKFVVILIIPAIASFLYNLSWLLPLLLYHQNPLTTGNQDYTAVSGLQFLSFATFPNAFSLLHPNWPENIFGKIYFMRPEFIFLPIFSAIGLITITCNREITKKNGGVHMVIIFMFFLLVGAFLAKGLQQPFPQINQFFFSYIPGFSMFRDPTKFYLLTALSFTFLIPYTIENSFSLLRKKSKTVKPFIKYFMAILFLSIWSFQIRFALQQQLQGTFLRTNQSIPKEYIVLKNRINNDKSFYRTLWLPKQQRFSFSDDNHPIVEFNALFSNKKDKSGSLLQKKENQILLQDLSIKYIIVPDDISSEIFVKNHTYDNSQYIHTIAILNKISWLRRKESIGKLVIYEVPDPQPHIYLQNNNPVHVVKVNNTEYMLTFKNTTIHNGLVFSEAYDPHWIIKGTKNMTVTHLKTEAGTNRFVLDKTGTYTLTLSYAENSGYLLGRYIIIFFYVVSLFALLMLKYKLYEK